jgi:hypothetical protein
MQKEIEVHNSGITASYWRVHFFAVDWNKKEGRIGVVAYANKAARAAGKQPVPGASISITLGSEDIEKLGAIKQKDLQGANNAKDIDLKKSYHFLRNQQIRNPRFGETLDEPESIPGLFATSDTTDVK